MGLILIHLKQKIGWGLYPQFFSKDGNQRAHFLIKELINKAYREGANIPYTQNTPYINTIPPEAEVKSGGDQNIERRIRSLIRWNAAGMVVRANKKKS
ncbi:MAG: hypothetical protein CM1200mP13_14260 [Candidatus Pelagibacterales bacterium]|nr:MAG: hypothetical protein CM1200mP13_14260 [Pelagibacterales bacterium]